MERQPAVHHRHRTFYGAVTVGERGQIVIPAEARKEQGIEPADKLLVFTHPHTPGLLVVKVGDLESLVGALQGMLELVQEESVVEPEA